MKRWMLRIVLCLLFGVVTTVGVAWGCAVWLPSLAEHLIESPEPGLAGFVHVDVIRTEDGLAKVWFNFHRAAGVTGYITVRLTHLNKLIGATEYDKIRQVARSEGHEALPRWSLVTTVTTNDDSGVQLFPHRWVLDRAFGVPFRSLSVSFKAARNRQRSTVTRTFTSGGINLPDRTPRLGEIDKLLRFRAIPLRPILPGFLINTLFYGIIWFTIFYAPGAARRSIRRRGGRCVKCGYDLLGNFHSGCSECGWGRESLKES